MADRLVGSPEVYGHKRREAEQSVNFVTCHDGFTLNDLVSYNQKHNEANGEQNRDGNNDNKSWNCGVEGPTGAQAIEELRNRQVKNFLTTTMLSIGLPMILMGDEVRRSQGGNNNAYCHDDESTWFDWSLLKKHADILRFTQLLNARRLLRSEEHEKKRVSLCEMIERAKKSWHGVKVNQPDWGDNSRAVGFLVEMRDEKMLVYILLSAYWEALDFELPPTYEPGGRWRRWIDTSLPSPGDIVEWQAAIPVTSGTYCAGPHSVAVLISEI